METSTIIAIAIAAAIIIIGIIVYRMNTSTPADNRVPKVISIDYGAAGVGNIIIKDAAGGVITQYTNATVTSAPGLLSSSTIDLPGIKGMILKMNPAGKVLGVKSIIFMNDAGKETEANMLIGDVDGSVPSFFNRPPPGKMLARLGIPEMNRLGKNTGSL